MVSISYIFNILAVYFESFCFNFVYNGCGPYVNFDTPWIAELIQEHPLRPLLEKLILSRRLAQKAANGCSYLIHLNSRTGDIVYPHMHGTALNAYAIYVDNCISRALGILDRVGGWSRIKMYNPYLFWWTVGKSTPWTLPGFSRVNTDNTMDNVLYIVRAQPDERDILEINSAQDAMDELAIILKDPAVRAFFKVFNPLDSTTPVSASDLKEVIDLVNPVKPAPIKEAKKEDTLASKVFNFFNSYISCSCTSILIFSADKAGASPA